MMFIVTAGRGCQGSLQLKDSSSTQIPATRSGRLHSRCTASVGSAHTRLAALSVGSVVVAAAELHRDAALAPHALAGGGERPGLQLTLHSSRPQHQYGQPVMPLATTNRAGWGTIFSCLFYRALQHLLLQHSWGVAQPAASAESYPTRPGRYLEVRHHVGSPCEHVGPIYASRRLSHQP